jgi:hypothetical protein
MLTIFGYRLPFGRRSKMKIWVVGRGGFGYLSIRGGFTRRNWIDLLVPVNRKAAKNHPNN